MIVKKRKMTKMVMNTFLFTIILWATIAYDISSHGSLESSKTGQLLKDAGILIYVKPYYNIIEEKTISFYSWGEKNFPYKEVDGFKNRTAEISITIIKKTVVFTQDICSYFRKYSSISYNYVSSRLPPDFVDKVTEVYCKASEISKNATSAVGQFIIEVFAKIQKWITNNISKDTFTWKNMEKVYFDAAQRFGIYYSNTAGWIERKFKCLISA